MPACCAKCGNDFQLPCRVFQNWNTRQPRPSDSQCQGCSVCGKRFGTADDLARQLPGQASRQAFPIEASGSVSRGNGTSGDQQPYQSQIRHCARVMRPSMLCKACRTDVARSKSARACPRSADQALPPGAARAARRPCSRAWLRAEKCTAPVAFSVEDTPWKGAPHGHRPARLTQDLRGTHRSHAAPHEPAQSGSRGRCRGRRHREQTSLTCEPKACDRKHHPGASAQSSAHHLQYRER
mmetsp:Transcript_31176/g.99396  ORF Transcript_31176/g.99396 Transcript_31176/m.99396 type:complete len:239 (-) Transcript_31176:1731-2447(-)